MNRLGIQVVAGGGEDGVGGMEDEGGAGGAERAVDMGREEET